MSEKGGHGMCIKLLLNKLGLIYTVNTHLSHSLIMSQTVSLYFKVNAHIKSHITKLTTRDVTDDKY